MCKRKAHSHRAHVIMPESSALPPRRSFMVSGLSVASSVSLTDMGATFVIASGGVLTLFIAAAPNGGSVWVRVVDEDSAAVFEQKISADLPANTQFLSPRLFTNNGATAAAVAYDCSGVYEETDF